ncbi:site-specific integrase [Pseudobacteroides cellulosolvens]|uniref:Integrase family protein n=1 Tax=Pseudobacteroides cellulosolvens ATCC 35603 = DSM 2933 TaxID=398512 RepID=A0A0L6JTK1_9FIRM|nr:site-specific integrase [Pseudobacteroides cellulosolvens]KNY29049.1 integrase family protein [Pseudobacteroides cellulosolvens ATCC 35603 = DSM 2933]
MDNNNSTTITELINAAQSEIVRLQYKRSRIGIHDKEMRVFARYCESNKIMHYRDGIGQAYFRDMYGLDIRELDHKLTRAQLNTRCSLRFLDDIYEFGYARRNSHHDYQMPREYQAVLNAYLSYCSKNKASEGTLRVKRTKLRRFFEFLQAKGIHLSDISPKDISEFIVTLAGYSRPTLHIFTSVLSCFLRYLQEVGTLEDDLSPLIPKPRIYTEESIPKTWTPKEVRQLLKAIDRTSNIGKRDYAMILLAVILGMRVGDICALKFMNLDWKAKLITFVQQKTGKSNALPILPEIGDAIIDYLKNGRIDTDCDNVFVKHIHPYGAITSSSALAENIKRYMRYAGLKVQNRKVTHSLRHTLASSLLREGTPLMTISNVLGHYNPATTVGYIKVDLASLKKCSLSYGRGVLAE